LCNAVGARLPSRFRNGMFVGQHGSWNRKPRSGYKVVFVPFADGAPAGTPLDLLTRKSHRWDRNRPLFGA